jgi:hypothetical protein
MNRNLSRLNWFTNLHASTNPLRERSVWNYVHQCDVGGRCCPVWQLPRRLRELGRKLRSHHNHASRMDDPIELHHLQFGDWQSQCLCKGKLWISVLDDSVILILFELSGVRWLSLSIALYNRQHNSRPSSHNNRRNGSRLSNWYQ